MGTVSEGQCIDCCAGHCYGEEQHQRENLPGEEIQWGPGARGR